MTSQLNPCLVHKFLNQSLTDQFSLQREVGFKTKADNFIQSSKEHLYWRLLKFAIKLYSVRNVFIYKVLVKGMKLNIC